jgi:hypothetical protein
MSNPLVANLKSLMMTQDTATAPAAGTPKQVTGTATTTVISSVDLDEGTNAGYVMHVFEALNGNCKGQLVLGTAHDNAGNVTVTSFNNAAPSTTQFKHWVYSWPAAVPTTDGSTTTVIASARTEADDYWNSYYMLSLAGENTALRNITDFDNGSTTFTTDAFDTATDIGDAMIPVQPMQPDSVEITIDGGTAIEREIITDSLDPEGIVVGAIESAMVNFSAEVRGLATAAGEAVVASPPAEMHVALSSVFTETLDTGDTVGSGSDTTKVVVADAANYTQYSLALVNGDIFAISSISNFDLNAPTGHLSSAAVSGDICYAGANYKPKDSAWKSCSFLAWYGDAMLLALTGGMPEIGASVEGNGIAKYNCNYSCVGGFLADVAKPHNDIYDTSTPVVGKANVSRVVYDGAELDADVLSCNFTFLDAPVMKGAAFGAYENNGGHIYTTRTGSCSMVVQMEDSSYCQQYRAGDEVDLLVQVGSVATAAWGVWAPRCQLVSNPDISDADGLFQITLELRFLRPTTAGQPAYVLAHF